MKKILTPAIVLSLFASACNNLEQVDQKLTLKFDPALSQESKDLLRSDLKSLEQYQFQAKVGGYFDKSFGGASGEGLLKYLDDRVTYLIPQVDDLTSRLKLGIFPLPTQGGNHSSPDPTQGDDRAVVMALNIGFALWLNNEANPLPLNLRFQIGSESVPLTSPRVGIVELGKGYTLKQSDGSLQYSLVERVATLIHEARHSDCTGGLLASDLERLKHGEMPENHECGHMHIACPAGHPLEGLPACDDLAWGAYSIEGVFAASLAKDCNNCSLIDRAQAVAAAADAFSRVTVLADMVAGKLGGPDMSSSKEVRKSDPAVQKLLGAIQAQQQSDAPQAAKFITE